MDGSARSVRLGLGSAESNDGEARFLVTPEIAKLLEAAPRVIVPTSRRQVMDLALGGPDEQSREVAFNLPEGGRVVEATVVRCHNGIIVHYPEKYMRRRDPECLLIADTCATDKPTFGDRFGVDFDVVRPVIHDYLATQELVVVPFLAGGSPQCPALAIVPAPAAFFAAAIIDLQGGLDAADLLCGELRPRAIIFVAPTFRHTHCAGRQIVVHDRTPDCHEVYALNLAPPAIAPRVLRIHERSLDGADLLAYVGLMDEALPIRPFRTGRRHPPVTRRHLPAVPSDESPAFVRHNH